MTAKSAPTVAKSKPQAPEPNPGLTAEAITFPSDPLLEQLQQEQDELHKPGRVSKADAEHIDSDPGYNRDQLAHMREYYGT